jgi:hypothetical protein
VIGVPLLVVAQPECNYTSPIDDTPITSWAQRREDLAKHGCRPYDPMMKDDHIRHEKEREAALDQAIESTVEAEIGRMPGRKRAALHSELVEQGVDMKLERSSK